MPTAQPVTPVARIADNAEGGEILAPIVVRELAAGKQFMFADLGEIELRGAEDPVRLYKVRWRGERPVDSRPDQADNRGGGPTLVATWRRSCENPAIGNIGNLG